MTTPDSIIKKVNWANHAKRLASAITPHHVTLLELSWREQQKKFPVIGDFSLKNPNVAKVVKTLATRIVGISEYTRTEVRSMLEQAFTTTETIPGTDEIARRFRTLAELDVPEDATPKEKRRAGRRAQTIARTESQRAFNHGALTAYAEAGIEKVEILDSDNDEECAARNGKIVSLEEALEIEPHPNCVMALVAVVD